MKGLLEIKDYVGNVKDVDTVGRRVTGFLTAFNNKDHDGDIAEKGMFAKTIMERKNQIFFLNQHKWDQPHGKFAVLEEKEEGLYFESEKLPNTSYSNDVLELYKEGILKEHSYGFVTTKSVQDKERGARILKEVKLFEGSNVTVGANSNTPFTGFKSLTITQINEKSSAIMKMLRTGTLTDDTFLQLEYALKQLQMEAYQIGQKEALESKEPGDHSTEDQEPLIVNTIKSFINSLN